MAGAGYKLYSTGDVLTASDVNTYIQQQTVMVFANAAARTTALSGVLAEGMITYLKDTDAVEKYDGSSWVSIGGASSPLTTKGDLYTYSTTNARLAVGNNGETLVADSSATTGLRWQGNFAAGKNAIINGDFRIWQRGTSFSNPKGVFLADRYAFNYDGTGNLTASQQTFTAGTAPVAGYEGQFFLRLNQTTAGSGTTFSVLQQPIEDVRTFAGQTVTVSFWAKADATRTLSVTLRQDFGSGGSSVVDTAGSGATLTTSWVRYTNTITVPSVSGKTIGTGSALRLFISLPINTTQTIDIWGVQIEAGNVATAFQTATGTLAGELAACQRYYTRHTAGSNYSSFGAGLCRATTSAHIAIQHPVQMRVAPTSLDYSTVALLNSTGSPISATAVVLDYAGTQNSFVTISVASGLTVGNATLATAGGSTSSYIGFNAEL